MILKHQQQIPYMAFHSLYFFKKKKKKKITKTHPHIRSPRFNLSHLVVAVLSNAPMHYFKVKIP
jgi:hypothetical protein